MDCSSMGPGFRLRKWRRTEIAVRSIAIVVATATALHAQENSSAAMPASTNAPLANINPSSVNEVAPNDGASSNIYKTMSLQELMDQQVTSVSKTPEPLSRAPAAIQVITDDEIRRSGATSLPEALRLADNLEVAQDNAHDWNISSRGFNALNGDKLLVLIDGRTVYTPFLAGVNWDVENVMLADLDRIEVVSGPGGTLWGANAVNGVINIVSKSAQDTQGWYMEGIGGSELRDYGAIRYGGTLAPNLYFRVYGTYFDHNNEDYSLSGARAPDAWSEGRGGFRIDTAGVSDDKFTLQGDYYNGAAGDPAMPGTSEVESGGDILGRWTHTLSPDSDMSLQVYYDRTNNTTPEPAIGIEPAGILTENLDTADLSFQHNFQAGDRNKITWGTGYRFYHDVMENAPGVQFLPPVRNLSIYNFFAQDEIKVQDDLSFILGTKVEHNDYTGFEFEPSGRLRWNFTPNHMVWAAISRAVRTPSIGERDLYEPTGLPPPFQSALDGSSSFTSEKLIAYELGYRGQLSSKVSGAISTFYNVYSDIRSTTPGPASSFYLPVVEHNNLEGQTYGLEATADYQALDWWRLHAGYDYLQEHIHVKPGQIDFTNALNETADPKNQVFLRTSMDLPKNLEFDITSRWIDSLRINNGPIAANVPSYFELDARLAWHPTKNLEVSIVGQNLLHDHHVEYGFPNSTQEAIVRSVYGKISWHF